MKDRLMGEGSGHDWWHTYRVWKIANTISEKIPSDNLVIQLSALLHDVEDWKFHDGNEDHSLNHAREFLTAQKLSNNKIEHVCEIIKTISFKGVPESDKVLSIEAKIVQDADRLDAIGAIGIARVFSYGGYKGREIYNPNISVRKFNSKDEYINNIGTSINHFYEKLLLLKDLMNTDVGKQLATNRHNFLLAYLDEFYKEWEGEK